MMRMRSSAAGAAARPRAVRLDELPAEVPAEALCWRCCRTASTPHAWQGLHSLMFAGPARAGPAGVRGSSPRAVCPLARGLDTGPHAADSLQVRTALTSLKGRTSRERGSSWERARSDRRFKQALEAPFWTTLHPDVTGRLWQALGHPSAFPAPLASQRLCFVQCTA